MAEGQTCYENDEAFCEDQMCLRTGCRLKVTPPKPKQFSDVELMDYLGRAVKGARAQRPHLGKRPRWVAVMDTFHLGSTYAHLLCRKFGLDPDEMVK
jgi:hypothetical protein